MSERALEEMIGSGSSDEGCNSETERDVPTKKFTARDWRRATPTQTANLDPLVTQRLHEKVVPVAIQPPVIKHAPYDAICKLFFRC